IRPARAAPPTRRIAPAAAAPPNAPESETGIGLPPSPTPGAVVYPLKVTNQNSVTLGRAADNQIVLRHPRRRRYHAPIDRLGARVRLRDLRSTNGVFVNGQRIKGDAWLKQGDEIRLGPYVFKLSGDTLHAQAETGLGLEASGLNRRV